MAEAAKWQKKIFSSFKKTVSHFVRIGTFYYLYRVLAIHNTIAMVCRDYRDDIFTSPRGLLSIIAMKLKDKTIGFTKIN